MSIARLASRQGSAAVVAASPPLLPRPASLPHRRPPQQTPARAQRALRCSARLTSSRDSLDEEHLEKQQPPQQPPQQPKRQAVRNGRPRGPAAAPAGLEQQAQAQPSGLAEQQELMLQQAEQQAERELAKRQRVQQEAAVDQQLAAGRGPGQAGQASPHQLTIPQLQQLTDLHVEDSFKLGVVASAAELAECLGTDLRDGLRDGQAELAARAEQYGANVTRPPQEVTFLQLVLEALQDFTILILIGAGSLSLVLEFAVNQHTSGEGSWIEGASILAAVCVVVLVTAVNNYQKEQQFRMLQAVSSDVKVRGIRNGREQALPVKDVLVGELLLVEAGDILVADGLLVAGTDVKVDESHLTGEADDITKDPYTRPALLGASKILSGFGRMLVTSVGPYSQSGMIAEMVANGKPSAALTPDGRLAPAAAGGIADGLREETLLQRKLAEYATSIGRFGLGAASLAFAAMTVRFSYTTFVVEGASWDWAFLQDYLRFFITGVTILVVAVPEGLPLAVTLALAFSVRRMLADHNLVRHLSAAETMGTANVVCSDKTGTLTQNDMVVSKLWLAGHLLPDLLPYTRRANKDATEGQRGLAEQALAKSKQQPAGAGAGSTSGTRGTTGSSFSSAPSASALPPLADVVRSSCSSATSTAGSTEGSGAWEPRSSILESVTAGAAPADVLQLLVESVALNSTANIYSGEDGKEKRIGNRTEVALLDLARLLGAKPKTLRRQQRQIAQVPFSSERKCMTTVSLPPGYDPDGDTHLCRIYTKGASEIVLEKCSYVLTPDGTRRRLHSEEKEQLMAGFCEGAQRVLCLAYRDVTMPADSLVPASAVRTTSPTGSDSDSSSSAASGYESNGTSNGAEASAKGNGNLAGMGGEWVWDAGSLNTALNSEEEEAAAPWDESLTLADNLESNLTLLAMVGIEDPLREEVPAAILQCQAAGITVKMLTGDNVATATAIARECGILPPPGAAWSEWLAGHSTAAAATASESNWYSGSSQDSSANLLEAGSNLGSGGGNMGATLDSADRPAAGMLAASRNGSGSRGGSASTTTAVNGCAQEVEVEIINDELPDGVVMEGPDFRRRVLREDGSINAEKFLELWPKLRVLARCSPTDKYTIVTGVRSLTKDVVAVTGDGTNDAPALRAANIGFAMNAGTDTAKEAADIVLLDNNFASIVSAVLWGRNVYANITRFLQFQLTINLVAVATAVTGAVVASESPLTAVQMLWVNLIMDSLASLALATEPPDTRMLAIPPFSQEHEFVDPRTPTVKHIIGQATYQLAVLAGLIFYGPALLGIPDHTQVVGPSVHYTVVFNTFVFMQLFNQLNARKVLDSSVAWDGLGNAKWFQWILGSELVLQTLIVQFGGNWFNTAPLDGKEWAVCVGLGATTLGLREILRRLPYGRMAQFDA